MRDAIQTEARRALRRLKEAADADERHAIRLDTHQAVWRALRLRGLVVEHTPKVPELTEVGETYLEHETEALALGVDIAEAVRAWGIASPELMPLAFDAAWAAFGGSDG